MPRPSRQMKNYKRTKIPAMCRKHPTVPAVKGSLCQSCLAYKGLGETLNKGAGKPAPATK